jgi:hypothetical protein
MRKSDDQRGSRKGASDRSRRLESELKANLRKRKDQARARADVKPDAPGLPEPARDKDDA